MSISSTHRRLFSSDGFSHIAIPLAIVVVVAIVGIYTLVVTHAQTPSQSSALAQMSAKTKACGTLYPGGHGECVIVAQKLMMANDPEKINGKWKDLPHKLDLKGNFGKDTEDDIVQEQKWCHITPNGIIDHHTWVCLLELPNIPVP